MEHKQQQPDYEPLDPARLRSGLCTEQLGREVRVYDSLASTQDKAREWALKGAPHGALVVTEEQSAGRGRFGRPWHSPKGLGVWMSLVLKPPRSLTEPFQLTLLIAVALCRTVRKITGANAGIKWPNDLLIDGRKVSGILVEAVPAKPGEEQAYVAGIGIGVNLAKSDYPAELREKAISLRLAKGELVDRHELICLLLEQVETLYELYLREGFSPVISLWEAHSITLGTEITVQSAGGERTGIAVRLDDTGALVLRQEDGSAYKLFSGDVQPKTG